MAKLRGKKYEDWDDWTDCYICGEPQPNNRFHRFPWHVTCDDDEAGKRKVAQWVREQKAVKKAAIPTLDVSD